MNIGNECFIIYDKYGGVSHSFNNSITSPYTVKSLFEKQVDNKNKIEYLTGRDVINRFNEKFGATYCNIPNDLNHDILVLHMFSFKNDEGCDIIITIVSLNTNTLQEYHETHKDLPNKDFIIKACRFHISYEKQFGDSYDNQDIVNKIIEKVMIPTCDIMESKIDDPSFINPSIQLRDYQKSSIKWMYDTELKRKKIYFGNNYSYEIELGSFVFDIITKTIQLKNNRDYVEFTGGALIDEVGNGKTIQSLTLSLLNPATNISYVDIYNQMLKSRATLIICPNHLCGQWSREIDRMISKKNIKVVSILTKLHFNKYTYQELLDADFVIMSYNFVGNDWFAENYTKNLSKSKSYHKSSSWNHEAVSDILKNMSKDLIDDPMSIFKKDALITLIYWHRIIIDEFHEAYTIDKYAYMKNVIPLLRSNYKWVLTGTPFDKNADCFYNMLDFVVDNKNTLGKSISNIKDVSDYMMDNFFRRNAKDFVLPELREVIVWSKFSHTERIMYNAYLSDHNLDKYSVIIRQLCCHPKIADEIKAVLGSCKTLEDIEKTMVLHYKKQHDIALKKVKKYERYIAKTERRIIIAEYSRQRKFLKQKGYRVEIEIPELVLEEDNIVVDDDTGLEHGYVISDDDNDKEPVFNESDEDNNDDEDNKPLIVVNKENQDKIIKLIKKQLDEKQSNVIKELNVTLDKQKEKLASGKKIYDGKKASYTFFNNMIDRIKKATDKSKLKYEKAIAKSKRKQEEGDAYESSESESDNEEDEDTCGICLCEISGEDVGVTTCGHIFCYQCLKTSINTKQKCPMCQGKQTLSDISLISFEKPVFTKENSSILVNKLELINSVGTKLTNLIYYLNSIQEHVIIFSQWDALLSKVGDVLTEHGIRNVFCRGNVFIRDKAIREFSSDDKIKVIMLSSESAASGANLTKASKVILLDPVSGSYEYRKNTEWQAIGRAYRLGQTKPVEIVRFIIKDTVEEDIYNENKIEDTKHVSKLVISEISDETITLSNDKLQLLTEAVEKAKNNKDNTKKKKTKTVIKKRNNKY